MWRLNYYLLTGMLLICDGGCLDCSMYSASVQHGHQEEGNALSMGSCMSSLCICALTVSNLQVPGGIWRMWAMVWHSWVLPLITFMYILISSA